MPITDRLRTVVSAATEELCLDDIVGMAKQNLALHHALDLQLEGLESRLRVCAPDEVYIVEQLMYFSGAFGEHLKTIDAALVAAADADHDRASAAMSDRPLSRYVDRLRTMTFETAMLAVEAEYAAVVVAADQGAADAATDRHTNAYMAMLDTPAWTARDVRRKLVEVLRQNGEVPDIGSDEAPMAYRAVIQDIHRLEARGC